MSKPRTEAGKRLMRAIQAWDLGERPEHERQGIELILAIEAEAAPPPLDGLEHEVWCWRRHTGHCVDGPSDAPAEAAPPPLDGLDDALVAEGVEAFRLTRDYVGEELLPALPGWLWFDWTEKARAALRDEGDTT